MSAGELRRGQRWLLRVLVVGAAVAAGFGTWLATRDNGSSTAAPESNSRIVSRAELAEAAVMLDQPIYWAGPVPGTELELIETAEGVRLSYLPQGTALEGATTNVLTIGSYTLADPVAGLERYAKQRGSIVRHLKGGRLVVTTRKRPQSVYFASPDNSVQVEVYDPSPRRAMRLALSGRIAPIR